MISDGPSYDAQFAVLISDYSVDEIMHRKEAQLGKGLLALVATLGQEQEGWVDSNQIFGMFSSYKVPEEKTAAILSQLAREGRLAVVESLTVDSPKTKGLAQKLKSMGLDSVLVITDQMADNLIMASRNLANVLIVEPRYADPLALVHFKKVLVTKGAMEQLKEMLS